jgi:hypothetical protein
MRLSSIVSGVILTLSVCVALPVHAQGTSSAKASKPKTQPLSVVESSQGFRSSDDVSADQLAAIEDVKAKKRCVPADFIREATVKDDKTIDITLSGRKYYAIKFKDKCHGLAFDSSFYYYLTPSRQLCARFDTIVTRSGSRCIIDKISKRDAPKPEDKKSKKKKSKNEKKPIQG